MSKIIKRSGKEVTFDKDRIINAITKANDEVKDEHKITKEDIEEIATKISTEVEKSSYSLNVENIQDMVERELVSLGKYTLSKAYIIYRYEHALARKESSLDQKILSLVEYQNEDIKQENSNKNPEIIPTQRDYMAGEISKDLTYRKLLPKDIVEAHLSGILHFHDADYFVQHSHNCCLVNLEDMLDNGTVISGTMIESPHTFSTACNIATQIIAQVASNQYGGQTISLAHLAKYVDKSRKKFYKMYESIKNTLADNYDEFIESMVDQDINRGIQILQYQITTLMTCNGQAPFVTVFMCLEEAENELQKKDLAKTIREVLQQRYQGTKNEKGIWITPAFPKLILALDEDIINGEYQDIKHLAAKCTSKRMVPDYISIKVEKELKNGDIYPCMGCVHGSTIIRYRHKISDNTMVTTVAPFEAMWINLSKTFTIKDQIDNSVRDTSFTEGDLYMDLENVEVYDTKLKDWVECKRIIRNRTKEWVKVKFNNGFNIKVTPDHPFEIFNSNDPEDYNTVYARDIEIGDTMLFNIKDFFDEYDDFVDYKIIKNTNTIKVEYITNNVLDDTEFSYDVTTESEHFEIEGLYSHNCRSFLTPCRFEEDFSGAFNADKYKGHKYYGRLIKNVGVTLNLVNSQSVRCA